MKELHQRVLKETVGLMQSSFYKSRFESLNKGKCNS